MTIGCDIDGVLFPWERIARDVLEIEFGVKLAESTYWTYLKDVLPRAQWDWLWSREGQDKIFGRTWARYPEAVEAVNALLKAGHRVHFVTHRDPRRTALHTAEFLDLHFGGHPWAGVHVIQNHVQKRRLASWDVFVDDKPETVFDFLANTRAQVFSPVRPWNVDELESVYGPTPEGCPLIHYTDPTVIVEWVEARA